LTWLDTLLDRGNEAKDTAEPPKQLSELPAKQELAMSRIRSVIITTQAPRGDDPGACEIGHFKIEDGYVVMCSEDGRPTGTKERLIGEDAQRVAGRLLREAWLKRADESDFNRAIKYADRGWR
jgi:hypothetical protein